MKKNAKALVAGLSSFLGSLAVGAVDNSLVMGEWVAAAAAAAAAVAVVYGVRNAPADEPVGD